MWDTHGESRGQRSLAGYSPWDCKELDTTERLTRSIHPQRLPKSNSPPLPQAPVLYHFLKYKFIYFNWRLITLQYCSGFAVHRHEPAMGVRVLPILNPRPPPPSPSHPSVLCHLNLHKWLVTHGVRPGGPAGGYSDLIDTHAPTASLNSSLWT